MHRTLESRFLKATLRMTQTLTFALRLSETRPRDDRTVIGQGGMGCCANKGRHVRGRQQLSGGSVRGPLVSCGSPGRSCMHNIDLTMGDRDRSRSPDQGGNPNNGSNPHGGGGGDDAGEGVKLYVGNLDYCE